MRMIVLVGARPSIVKVGPLLPALNRAGIQAHVAFAGSRDSVGPTEGFPDRTRDDHTKASEAASDERPRQGVGENPRERAGDKSCTNSKSEPASLVASDTAREGTPKAASDGHVSFYGVQIPAPRWFLDVSNGSDAVQLAAASVALEELLDAERPDAVLAVGDLNPTLAFAIAASKLGIPVAHLEAGLRCGSLSVPDEVNRVLISRVTAMHLAPDENAIDNLTSENVDSDRIVFVGSILAESVIRHAEEIRKLDAASVYGLQRGEYVTACFHRRENLSEPARCQQVLDGLGAIGIPVLVPDTNGVKRCVDDFGLRIPASVRVIGSVGYHDMLALGRDAAVLVTDSAGVQEEACMLGTPCVTVRDCTERVATIEVGANRLAEGTAESVLAATHDAMEGPRKWLTPKRWDKAVSQRVVRALKRGVTPLQ